MNNNNDNLDIVGHFIVVRDGEDYVDFLVLVEDAADKAAARAYIAAHFPGYEISVVMPVVANIVIEQVA